MNRWLKSGRPGWYKSSATEKPRSKVEAEGLLTDQGAERATVRVPERLLPATLWAMDLKLDGLKDEELHLLEWASHFESLLVDYGNL
jgi:hypothetical protein